MRLPQLRLRPLDACAETSSLAARLGKAASAIHPGIDLRVKPSKVALCLVVGSLAPSTDTPMIFLGSCGWTALLDSAEPVGSLDSGNPFGAAAAACLGVANTFRMIFSDEFAEGLPTDHDWRPQADAGGGGWAGDRVVAPGAGRRQGAGIGLFCQAESGGRARDRADVPQWPDRGGRAPEGCKRYVADCAGWV
ncbi:MAG: hypothetical protein B7Z75_14805 [Acidocella sp. 20-57-95]|nr:MAG: hypothetical protein B7Z75_14805 [Acidocella sp. 20-57-95]OYV56741.1 MAG: hypothetical protein B7Z71_12635 [Acidocella sp. 21-58-7]